MLVSVFPFQKESISVVGNKIFQFVIDGLAHTHDLVVIEYFLLSTTFSDRHHFLLSVKSFMQYTFSCHKNACLID